MMVGQEPHNNTMIPVIILIIKIKIIEVMLLTLSSSCELGTCRVKVNHMNRDSVQMPDTSHLKRAES